MNFISIRVITDDIKRLVAFYENVTGLSATWSNEVFAELTTPSCTLAIGHSSTVALFGAGSARAADNHSAIIELIVNDVDTEYEKVKTIIGDAVVQQPTTMPWGNRSLLFRDPDGNLINYFTPVSDDAKKKFSKYSK